MEILLFTVGAIICYLISAMIHEMGHVVCGLLHHWKLYMLVVGPLKLYRETLDSKLKIGLEKNPILWAGVGGTRPQEENVENVKVWGKILLAGPLTFIVFGVLMIPVFIVTKNIFVRLLCLMPIAMGLACIIPMKMKTGLLPKVKKPVTAETIYEQILKSAAAYPVVGEAQLYLELTEKVNRFVQEAEA